MCVRCMGGDGEGREDIGVDGEKEGGGGRKPASTKFYQFPVSPSRNPKQIQFTIK